MRSGGALNALRLCAAHVRPVRGWLQIYNNYNYLQAAFECTLPNTVDAKPAQVLCSAPVWTAALAAQPTLQASLSATSMGVHSYKGVLDKLEVLEVT